jgi:tetratricopeptide (TPR) repeat protein
LFRRANDFATVRKYDKAVECIEQAIAQAPQDPDLETFLHYYRFLHKRHTTLVNPSIAADAVLREFIESGKGSPRTPQGNLLLARLFRFAGRAETAAGFYAKALELDPECQEARKELATSPARATSLIPT